MVDAYSAGDVKPGGSAPPIEPGLVTGAYLLPDEAPSSNARLAGLFDPANSSTLPTYQYFSFAIKVSHTTATSTATDYIQIYSGYQNSNTSSWTGIGLAHDLNLSSYLFMARLRPLLRVFGDAFANTYKTGDLLGMGNFGTSLSNADVEVLWDNYNVLIDRSGGVASSTFKVWKNGFLICNESEYPTEAKDALNHPTGLSGFYPFLVYLPANNAALNYVNIGRIWVWSGDSLPTEEDITTTAFAQKFFDHETMRLLVPDTPVTPQYLHSTADILENVVDGKQLTPVGDLGGIEVTNGIKIGLLENDNRHVTIKNLNTNDFTMGGTTKDRHTFYTRNIGQDSNLGPKFLIACFIYSGFYTNIIGNNSDSYRSSLYLNSKNVYFFAEINRGYAGIGIICSYVDVLNNKYNLIRRNGGPSVSLPSSRVLSGEFRIFFIDFDAPPESTKCFYDFESQSFLTTGVEKNTGDLSVLNLNIQSSYFASGTAVRSESPRIGKTWIYDNATIVANPGIDWENPSNLLQFFKQPDKFNAITENFEGSRALGIKPSYFFDSNHSQIVWGLDYPNSQYVYTNFGNNQYIVEVTSTGYAINDTQSSINLKKLGNDQ